MEKKEKIEKSESKLEEPKKETKWREILILTDGNNVRVEKANVNGKIELIAILQNVVNFLLKSDTKS